MKKIFIFCLCIIGMIMILLFPGCGMDNTVAFDPFSYVNIEVSGTNSAGTLNMEVNKEALKEDLTNICGEYAQIDDFIDTIKFQSSQSSGLNNQDIVTITVNLDNKMLNQLGLYLSQEEITQEISGLTELYEINPFDKLQITYNGIAPCIQVDIYYENDGYLDTTCFNVETDEDHCFLDIGDKYTISLSLSDEELQKKGIKIIGTSSKEYTISNKEVDRYVSNASEMQQETLEDMKQEVYSKLQNDFGDSFVEASYLGYQVVSLKDVNSYAKDKNFTDGFPESPNKLNMACQVTFVQNNQNVTWYMVISFNNIIISTNGTQEYKIIDQAYAKGNSSYVTLDGLKAGLANYDTSQYNATYSSELQ